MMVNLDYDIHGILKFRIRTREKIDPLQDLNLMFEYFRVDRVENPDVVLNIGPFVPDNTGCCFIDHKYFIREQYFYCRDSQKNAGWEVEINGLETHPTVINFRSAVKGPHFFLLPDLLSQNFLLLNLLEYYLWKKGYYLIQAAAVEKGGKGFLLAGRGGAGKTTLVMDLIRNHGYGFIGEELVLVKNGRIFSFPIHFGEFNYRLRHLPEEHLRGFRDKLGLLQHLWRCRSDVKRGAIRVLEDVPLGALGIIIRKDIPYLRTVMGVDLAEAAGTLLANSLSEWNVTSLNIGLVIGGAQKYMMAYGFVFPGSEMAIYWRELRKDYELLFGGTDRVRFELPQKYSPDQAEEISRVLTAEG